MKKILSLLLCVLMVGQMAGIASANSGGGGSVVGLSPINVGLNAAAFAYGAAAGNEPSMAVDGDAETFWLSQNGTELRDFLILDLGARYSIDSIYVTVPEGVAQNFTVYGANDPKQTDKSALTDAVSGLTPGEDEYAGDILDHSPCQFIIFEQAAEETTFGFAEIEIMTRDAAAKNHVASGTAGLLSFDRCAVATDNLRNWNGNAAYIERAGNIIDGNPTTYDYNAVAYSETDLKGNLYVFDLGENNAQKLSHVAYQFGAVSSSINPDCDGKFKIIGIEANKTNDWGANPFRPAEPSAYDVLAEMDGEPNHYRDGIHYDSGLMVFPVAEEYRDTAYRYVGILKTEMTDAESGKILLGASTLQAYKKGVALLPLKEVAHNQPAFAYSSESGTGPALAVDGDSQTVWKSAAAFETVHDNFVLDLGAVKPIEAIDLQLADEDCATGFTVYGSHDLSAARTKLCDVTEASAEGMTRIFENGEAAYRYLVFDKAPGGAALGFAEIEVYARAAAGSGAPVSLVSAGKDVITIPVSAYDDKKANLTDSSAETGSGITENTSDYQKVYYFVDLGMELPISHVTYQSVLGTNANPITNRNESATGFKIVATNEDPQTATSFTELNAKEGWPYVGGAMASNLAGYGAGSDYDTGLWVFPGASSQKFRYVGILKDTPTFQQTTMRLNAYTLQVYSRVIDVERYVAGQGSDRLILSEGTFVAEDVVDYEAEILNGAGYGKVVGLFGQKDKNGATLQRAYAEGSVALPGAYNNLQLSAQVENGMAEDTIWELATLEGRTITTYFSDLAKGIKLDAANCPGTSTAGFAASGLDVRVSGKVAAGVIGMVILKPGADTEAFGAEDIYTCQLQVAPETANAAWNYNLSYTMPDSAEPGDYPVILVTDTGVLTEESTAITVFDMEEIKMDFGAATEASFLGLVEKHKEFFGEDLYNALVTADGDDSIGASFAIAKEGIISGLFKDTAAAWGESVNDIQDAVKAALLVDVALAGDAVSTLAASYGTAIPKVFGSADYDAEEFDEILSAVLDEMEADDAESLMAAYNRTLGLSLIANGSKKDKVAALENYSDALGINEETFGSKYTLLDIAGKLSGNMSTVKNSYAGGMDSVVEKAVKELKGSSGSGSQTLGSGSGSGRGSSSLGVASLPREVIVTNEAPEKEATEAPEIPDTTPVQVSSFADVTTNHSWALSAIESLSAKGILAGNGDGTFNPDGQLTREQATKLLILTLDLPITSSDQVYRKDNGYQDCVYSAWYYPYVTFAKDKKLVEGQGRGVFGIGQSVTRQDLAVMIYRALALKGLMQETTAVFTDDDAIADYAKEAVSALGGMGIITGFPDGSFGPQAFTTRAQASVIFERFLHSIEAAAEEVVSE